MSKKTNIDKIREAKELERAKARPRSVDNDILFSLPTAKAMMGALAAGIVSRGAPLPVHWRKGAGEPDAEAFLPGLTRQALDSHSVDHILVNAFAFGGSNAALILSRWRA